MKHVSAFLAAACASAALPSTNLAWADDTLDQIIVTGARAPLSTASIGNAVTVISRDDIERRQARFVADVLDLVPGFSVSRSGGAGSQTQVRVRGAEANHVLVLVDGMRANDPASGDEFRWEFLTTANIERIEIVRGPQSALWGSDALAGVVNIITRSGNSDSALDAYVEAGSNDTHNSAVNGNLTSGNWMLGFSLEQLATDGNNFSRAGAERDRSDTTTIAVSASWQAGDGLALNLSARAVDAYSQYDNVDYFVTGLPADSDVGLDTMQHYLQLKIAAGGPDSRIRHQLGVGYFDSENRNMHGGVEDISAMSDRLHLNYQAHVAFGKERLSLAVEHERSTFEQRGPVGFADPNQRQETDVASAVVDYEGHLGENMTWLASARYDQNDAFEDAVTGRLALAWPILPGTRLRASAGTGRKNPTFIELYGFFPGQFVNNPNLRPEKSKGFDLGIEQQLTDKLGIQFTVFRQDLEDEINGFVYDPATFLATADNMAGDSRRQGMEFVLRWDLSESASVHANYAYVDAAADDVREVRRPRHAGNVDLDYGFLDGRGRIGLTAVYGGSRTDTFFPPWPNPPEVVTLANHWLADLTVRYSATPAVDLFARATNLLDTRYEHVYGYRTPGRAVFAGVRVEFGR